ncbi:radical SAM family heme chaperone HemW [bacterium]|nr:radical SAM family heme chaperone HemW [bacterium]
MKKVINHLYIHYPFCTSRCGYCSFYTEAFSWARQTEYLKLLQVEINSYVYNSRYDLQLDTIYFGGGTPSLLSSGYTSVLTSIISEKNKECEITLECNPITMTEAYIKVLKLSGVNRLSIGIQSMNEKNLKYLGRRHSPKQVIDVVSKLRKKKYNNISGDLIYGIPHQTLADVEKDIEEFIKLGLDHISIYCLSLDDDAPLAKDKKLIPKDEIVADMYQLICHKLREVGFEQYEISNFAKKNKYSRHNLAYWQQKDYLGLGPGAYRTLGDSRCHNGEYAQWKDAIEFGRDCPNKEDLSKKDLLNEYIMLQLRLNRGLDLEELNLKYGFKIWDEKKNILRKFIDTGYLEENQKRLCLTDKSRFISNYVISELMEE